MIAFGVLGPLTVHVDGHPVAVPGLLQRRLLAVLLSRVGQPVSAQRLADLIWDGEPPLSHRKTLQVYVHRLRRTLADRIEHGPAGYRIVATPEELDRLRFSALAAQARAARDEGRVLAADELLRQALALWRGEPYADVRLDDVLADDVRQLTEEYLQVREDSLWLALDLGRHTVVAAELAALTQAHPYREGLRALLMLALHRGGRPAEALRVYHDTAELLAEQLGTDPGATLRTLHAALLRDDPRLADIGACRLAELDEPIEAAEAPAPAPAAAAPAPAQVAAEPVGPVPAQLPADLPVFTGRAADLRRLDALVPADGASGTVISTIAGTAGVGKTSLAVHWAHRVADRFPDGQLYLNLRGFDPTGKTVTPAEALRAFLDGLGVPPERIPPGTPERAALFRSCLAGRRMLVLLDNARDAEQVRPLLPGSPGCLTLLTSRNPLPALIASHGAHLLSLDLPGPAEARQLLARRIGAARVEAEPDAADELVRRCARLPLALAVVAARCATRPRLALAEVARQLPAAARALDAFAGEDPVTDVRAVLSWSYRELSPAAARLLRLLGLHPGPDLATAAAAALAGTTVAQAGPLLTELTLANLITEPVPGRYGCHDLLRAYASELVRAAEPQEERLAATIRMIDHYLVSAYRASTAIYPHRYSIAPPEPVPGAEPAAFADYSEAIAWHREEEATLDGIVRLAAAGGFDTQAWQLVWCCYIPADRRGRLFEHREVERIGLAAARRTGDLRAQAYLHHSYACTLSWSDGQEEAKEQFAAAIELFGRCGDDPGVAHAHLNLSLVFDQQERWEEALHHGVRALEVFEAMGHPSGQAKTLNSTGWFLAMLGRYDEALRACEAAVVLLRELGDHYNEGMTWDSLGFIHLSKGDVTRAVECYRQALLMWRDLADPYIRGTVATRLGEAYLAADDAESAAEVWREALSVLEGIGHAHAERVRELLAGLEGRVDCRD
ncbi:BTAD domain-containing putative transcriptional regulator [Catellatospora sp. KI3]|uniref:AfsR/SARP family transcriptional regulator n=1 Tax=Catellatospora sp. KI3 TaxID=3041620 RepID=UPI0024823595|nr:BTAD domain-containing putative transcriptional regulator [Catellatospora sp. KI3]MDI1462428.1 BTAD domain-containing putative transcriptional regulator [Catellatospora sp. KI3]